jgi:hypothetical protein
VRYRFRYPEGPKDAETLLVDPRTSRIYIASKALDGDTHLYVAPAHPSTTSVNELSDLADIQWVPRAHGLIADLAMSVLTTGGAFAPDGRSFVLRTYTDAYLFRLDGTGPRAVARAVVAPPVQLSLPEQMQGEGVCFRRDGKALVISSEHVATAVDEVLLPGVAANPPSSPAVVASPSVAHADPSTAPAAADPSTTTDASSPAVGVSSPAPGGSTSAPPRASAPEPGHGGSQRPVVVGVLAVAVVAGTALLVRRRRGGSARSRR